jgi:uncharacterized protein YqhQ
MPEERFSYGGQAVIEGVMIRGRRGYATAFRLADGEVQVEKHLWQPLTKRHRLLGLPIVRGTPALIDALVVGYRSLMRSADVAAKSEGIQPPSPFQYALSIATALGIVVGGFVLAPSALIERLDLHFTILNLIEGGIRFAFFVLFIWLVSFMPDMRRVFQYHGAEHKVINAFEATGSYDQERAGDHRTLHQRCGTSFIFTVLFVGIVVHALVGWPNLWVRLLSRLLLLPIVAGVSYELVKLAGARKSSRLLNVLVAPGMWLQHITTREPSRDQVEVAIRALDGALELDGATVPA